MLDYVGILARGFLKDFRHFIKFCSLCRASLLHHDNKSWEIPEALMQSYEAVCHREFKKQRSLFCREKWNLRESCSGRQNLRNKDQNFAGIIVYETLQLVSISYVPFIMVNIDLICELCKSEKTHKHQNPPCFHNRQSYIP